MKKDKRRRNQQMAAMKRGKNGWEGPTVKPRTSVSSAPGPSREPREPPGDPPSSGAPRGERRGQLNPRGGQAELSQYVAGSCLATIAQPPQGHQIHTLGAYPKNIGYSPILGDVLYNVTYVKCTYRYEGHLSELCGRNSHL